MENINNYLELISKLLDGLRIPLGKYKQRDFNIFTAISDTYYKENLHSDIIAKILDPLTPRIGNIAYLHTFLEETDKDFLQYFQDENFIKIRREEGKIDILIHNGIQGIIIENKIHDAENRPNQLCRYYNWAKQKLGLEILRIFYIPLEKDLFPYIKDYNCEKTEIGFCKDCNYKEEIENTKNVLQKITRVLNIEELKRIINKCAVKADSVGYKAEDYRAAKVILEHYAKLLGMVRNNMADETTKQRDLLTSIFNNIKSGEISNSAMNDIKTITCIWDKRKDILNELLSKKLIDLGYKNNFTFDKGYVYGKQINADYAIHFYPAWGTFALAFTNKDKLADAESKLKRAVENAKTGKEYFRQEIDKGEHYDKDKNGNVIKRDIGGILCYWVHLNFDFTNIEIKNIQGKNPVDTVLDNAVKCFTELEKLIFA